VRTLCICGGMDDHANLVRGIWPWAQSVIMHGFARPMNGARPDSQWRGLRLPASNYAILMFRRTLCVGDFALQWDE
jgi:hypothetical protein